MSLADADYQFQVDEGSWSWAILASAGDIDGDDLADVGIQSRRRYDSGVESGEVYIFGPPHCRAH